MVSHSQQAGGPTLKGLAAPTAAHLRPQLQLLVDDHLLSILLHTWERKEPMDSPPLEAGGPPGGVPPCQIKEGPAERAQRSHGKTPRAPPPTPSVRGDGSWVPGVASHVLSRHQPGGQHIFLSLSSVRFALRWAARRWHCREHQNREVRAEPPLEEAALKREV